MGRLSPLGTGLLHHVKGCRSLLLVTSCTLVLVPLLVANLPLSLIYSKLHTPDYVLNLARRVNTERLEQAKHYFRQLTSSSASSSSLRQTGTSDTGELVICIITVDRAGKYYGTSGSSTGYLVQTAAAVHSVVNHDHNFPNTTVFICNVDTNPKSHTEMSYIKNHIHVVERHGSNTFKRQFPSVKDFYSKQRSAARAKEFEDYIYCLNASYTFQSDYILMLEDDIIPQKDIFDVVNYALTSRQLDLHNDKAPQHLFAYLKLYYPLRWQGYSFELDRITELICGGFLGGTVLLIVLSFVHRNNDYLTSWIYFVTGTILTIYALSVIGRQNMSELRRASPQLFKLSHAPGCCTQAMLYPRYAIQKLIRYLMDNSDMNKDLAISAFAKGTNLQGYFLEPNLAHHIGMYTSLQRAYKPPEEFLSNYVPLY